MERITLKSLCAALLLLGAGAGQIPADPAAAVNHRRPHGPARELKRQDMGMGRTQQGGTDHSLLVARYGPNQIDRRHQVAGKHPDPGGGQPDIYTDSPDTTAENRSQRHTRRTSVAVRRTVEHELQRRTRDHRHAGRTAKKISVPIFSHKGEPQLFIFEQTTA